MDGEDLAESVRRSEGRTLLCEILWPAPPLVDGVSNAAIAVAFGADLVLLNKFDGDDLAGVKAGLGRPVGVNVEPSPTVPAHRRADRENLERLAGADFVVITANPDAEVDTLAMISASGTVREVLPARPSSSARCTGAADGAGRGGEISRLAEVSDAVLIPAPGTVPGSREGRVAGLADAVREAGALVVAAVGTSQEGSDEETVRELTLAAQAVRADVLHLGDAGVSGDARAVERARRVPGGPGPAAHLSPHGDEVTS
jgi:hypothetical protein